LPFGPIGANAARMLYRARPTGPQLKSEAELQKMRAAGRLASECLQWLLEHVAPGVSTQEIDDLQMEFARKHGVTPAPLNYKGFPKSVCTSINEVICHGIPSREDVLKEGDIVGVDVTLIVDGFYGDNAATVPVGAVAPEVTELLDATLESLRRGIAAALPGNQLGDVGHAIQSYAEPLGYSVVRDFVGHGIGRQFHEPPQVCHYGQPGRGLRLRPGMTFTIEPMINQGVPDCRVLRDGWTAVTADRKLSAQFEHTIAVTNDGVEILTVQNDDGSWEPPGRGYGYSA
jgi:methionyl aminopeptidase